MHFSSSCASSRASSLQQRYNYHFVSPCTSTWGWPFCQRSSLSSHSPSATTMSLIIVHLLQTVKITVYTWVTMARLTRVTATTKIAFAFTIMIPATIQMNVRWEKPVWIYCRTPPNPTVFHVTLFFVAFLGLYLWTQVIVVWPRLCHPLLIPSLTLKTIHSKAVTVLWTARTIVENFKTMGILILATQTAAIVSALTILRIAPTLRIVDLKRHV